MNHLEALRTIAEYPASAQDDMQAANMRKIAQEALAGDVERLRSGVAREYPPINIKDFNSDSDLACYFDEWRRAGPGADAKEKFAWILRHLAKLMHAYADADRTQSAQAVAEPSFQQRVQPWLMECFGEMIAGDREERNHRFLEEALELVQSTGCSQSEAHQLVDYVFGRPVGEPVQEVGGVMVTLAALCLANDLDMHDCGETELARIWTKVEAIRAKQAAKPKHSPLPEALPTPKAEPAPIPKYQTPHDFKNFHRQLCARFGYVHDEQFWWRDLVSLIEHIASKAQPAVEPVAEWKQSTQGHPYWPHPIPHKGVPLPDGWLDDYITDCAKLNPGEMPGVYFVQGVRFAEQHHWGTSPAPAPNALDAETAIKNCLEAGETMRVLKRVVNLLLESRRNLGPEDHELRDRIDQLFRPDAAIAAQSAQGAKP